MKEEHAQIIAEQRDIRRYLGEQAIDAYEILFASINKNPHTMSMKSEHLNDALVTMVLRLIFVLYAEGRGLFPLQSELYRRRYSVTEIAEDLERAGGPGPQKEVALGGEFKAESRLQALWVLLFSGDDNLSFAAKGGDVFSPEKYAIWQRTQLVDDAAMRSILRRLRYHNGKLINYKEIFTEHLGSIYERLLEITVNLEDDHFELNTSKARIDSGSHYTPRQLCDFLTEKTVSPLLKQKSSSTEVLALRICDPAMGTGAFLLSACRYLGRRLFDSWKWEGIACNDIYQARKAVTESCLFGVDINEQAIRVAKLSLWLESGGNERFDRLDQNCKIGNSVVGATFEQMWNFTYHNNDANNSFLVLRNDNFFAIDRNKTKVIGDWFVAFLWACHGGLSGKPLGKKARQLLMHKHRNLAQQYYRSRSRKPPPEFYELVEKLPWEPFHWELQFEQIFASRNGFDAVLGNPPFINCIRGGVPKALKELLKERFPLIVGSADLSYYFLMLSSSLISENGRIGLILPRVSLGASALQPFRACQTTPKPELIYSADHNQFFDGASIKVVLYVFGKAKQCKVSDSDIPEQASWKSSTMDFSLWWPYYQHNWWAFFVMNIRGLSLPETNDCCRLDEAGFVITQGLTTGDYYNIVVEDAKDGEGLKLITSGIIEPKECLWGKSSSRFNGRSYLYPRIVVQEYGASLLKKIKRSQRPKIIVASLTRKIEAFFDSKGKCQASTATINIFHINDDLDQLRKLCDELHTKRSNILFTLMLEYNAMHSSINMEKSFLEAFPLPKKLLSMQ
jgi:hypothetical protein